MYLGAICRQNHTIIEQGKLIKTVRDQQLQVMKTEEYCSSTTPKQRANLEEGPTPSVPKAGFQPSLEKMWWVLLDGREIHWSATLMGLQGTSFWGAGEKLSIGRCYPAELTGNLPGRGGGGALGSHPPGSGEKWSMGLCPIPPGLRREPLPFPPKKSTYSYQVLPTPSKIVLVGTGEVMGR